MKPKASAAMDTFGFFVCFCLHHHKHPPRLIPRSRRNVLLSHRMFKVNSGQEPMLEELYGLGPTGSNTWSRINASVPPAEDVRRIVCTEPRKGTEVPGKPHVNWQCTLPVSKIDMETRKEIILQGSAHGKEGITLACKYLATLDLLVADNVVVDEYCDCSGCCTEDDGDDASESDNESVIISSDEDDKPAAPKKARVALKKPAAAKKPVAPKKPAAAKPAAAKPVAAAKKPVAPKKKPDGLFANFYKLLSPDALEDLAACDSDDLDGMREIIRTNKPRAARVDIIARKNAILERARKVEMERRNKQYDDAVARMTPQQMEQFLAIDEDDDEALNKFLGVA